MSEVHEFNGRKFRRHPNADFGWQVNANEMKWSHLYGTPGRVLAEILDNEFPLPWTPSVGDEVYVKGGIVKRTILAFHDSVAWTHHGTGTGRGHYSSVNTHLLVPWDGDADE